MTLKKIKVHDEEHMDKMLHLLPNGLVNEEVRESRQNRVAHVSVTVELRAGHM